LLTVSAGSYFDIIKHPVDLSSMSAKLEQGLYKDRFAFETDFRVMINNAKIYNVAESYVYNEATTMEAFFEKSE
jgi:transcription initiation factor TFIID subunit 2